MDYQIKWMWSKQDSAHRPRLEQFRGRGIVEGWYGDGNFNRTSLMYALWKTQGTSVRPWRGDLRFGAVRQGDGVALAIDADSAWAGVIRFDVPRHRDILDLPADWPRINSYPEWYTVDARARYRVLDAKTGRSRVVSGSELVRGIPLELGSGRQARLVVSMIGGAR